MKWSVSIFPRQYDSHMYMYIGLHYFFQQHKGFSVDVVPVFLSHLWLARSSLKLGRFCYSEDGLQRVLLLLISDSMLLVSVDTADGTYVDRDK